MALPQITIYGRKMYRISSGGASQFHMIVELVNEDRTQKQRLWWRETVPGRDATTIDLALLDKKLETKMFGISGDNSPTTVYTVVDDKTTVKTLVPDHVTTQIGIAQNGTSAFLVRFHPDKGGKFMVRFVGIDVTRFVGKPLIGTTMHWNEKHLPHVLPSSFSG